MTLALRSIIERALQRCSSCCLDNDEERRVVADAVLAAIANTADAHLIRQAFSNAPTGGTKLIAMRGLGGKREADVLNAAARLAQCTEVVE